MHESFSLTLNGATWTVARVLYPWTLVGYWLDFSRQLSAFPMPPWRRVARVVALQAWWMFVWLAGAGWLLGHVA